MAKKKLKKAKKQLKKNVTKHGPWSAGVLALGGLAGSILADAKVREKIADLISGLVDRVSDRLRLGEGDEAHA